MKDQNKKYYANPINESSEFNKYDSFYNKNDSLYNNNSGNNNNGNNKSSNNNISNNNSYNNNNGNNNSGNNNNKRTNINSGYNNRSYYNFSNNNISIIFPKTIGNPITKNTKHFFCNSCHTVTSIKFISFDKVHYSCPCRRNKELPIKEEILKKNIFDEKNEYNYDGNENNANKKSRNIKIFFTLSTS